MEEKIIVLGNGGCSFDITEQLVGMDIHVVAAIDARSADFHRFESLVSKGFRKLELLPITRCISCVGSSGHFILRLASDNAVITRQTAGIIIAENEARFPNFSPYGIESSDNVISLSQLKSFIESGDDPHQKLVAAKRIVFITGLMTEGSPIITEEVMTAARRLQLDYRLQTYILTGNLKVGGTGLENLYRQTKKAGTVYFKFTEAMPIVTTEKNGRITLSFFDEASRERFKISPDLTVVDETITRAELCRDIAKILNIDTGPGNFLQSDNVHRLTVHTNRKGIFVAGAGRQVQSKRKTSCDARNAALSVLKLIRSTGDDEYGNAVIDTGPCVRCLTCYRICPYYAVELKPKPAIVPQACEGCGICTAACPRGAITLETLEGLGISDRIPTFDPNRKSAEFPPTITAFCCSRSASSALELAKCRGYRLSDSMKIIDVPCGGGVSLVHLLAAFNQGADGVLVLSCHEGNCHSEKGNRFALQQVERLIDVMERSGFDRRRIMCRPLASNMGAEFVEMVNAFEIRISELAPSRLR